MTPLYHLTDVGYFYGDKQVLDIPELKIETGSITGILGPNGSGKSTLLKLLAFARKPGTGTILYKGQKQVPFSSTVRSKVTLLTQKPYLLKRTVFENIAYGLNIRRDKVHLEARVEKALSDVGLDYQHFAARFWHELSGGEAQRVAMAARLILKPEVLLLDEPVASVDTESAKRIREASLKARDNWGTTLVIASHDLQWLYSISDKQLSLFKGNIFSSGMENIITGPFATAGEKTLVKKINDGQIITLTPPAKTKCTAIIRKENICLGLEMQPDNTGLNQLSGHILSMLLEKKTGHILATISIHDLSLVIQLNPDQISSLDLYPGKTVILRFKSHDVEWI